jgi:hypothetical protein
LQIPIRQAAIRLLTSPTEPHAKPAKGGEPNGKLTTPQFARRDGQNRIAGRRTTTLVSQRQRRRRFACPCCVIGDVRSQRGMPPPPRMGRATMQDKTPLEIATDYLARGWNPVPVKYRDKIPIGEEWQNLIITEGNIATHFNGARLNVGVQLGPKSGDLTDVDLDCKEAVELAAALLPKTETYFGRESKPNSHFLYTIDDAPEKAAIKFVDKIGKGAQTTVELRLGGGPKGAQTVFPGSTHESGETIKWAHEGTPTHTDYATLKLAVTKIAVGTILRRNWPDGSGHNTALLLGGFLARVGWSEDEIEKFVYAVAPNPKWKDDSSRTAKDAAMAFARGDQALGLIADQEFGWGHSCDEFTKPIALLGPHSAALGMRFYTGNMFPSEYRNAVFIARHGSWNRTKKIGGDIVVANLSEDGTVKSIEPFITGFIENNNYVGRPADVEFVKDGSMLISDDFNGAVYRVTYSSTVGR